MTTPIEPQSSSWQHVTALYSQHSAAVRLALYVLALLALVLAGKCYGDSRERSGEAHVASHVADSIANAYEQRTAKLIHDSITPALVAAKARADSEQSKRIAAEQQLANVQQQAQTTIASLARISVTDRAATPVAVLAQLARDSVTIAAMSTAITRAHVQLVDDSTTIAKLVAANSGAHNALDSALVTIAKKDEALATLHREKDPPRCGARCGATAAVVAVGVIRGAIAIVFHR